MATDPRPHTARRPDGSEDTELERRMEELFRVLRAPESPRPTDAASSLAFLQELHARLAGGKP